MSEHIEYTTKSVLLDQILSERKRLENLLATLTPDQLLLPGASGAWTVKDVLAHISAWERCMIHWMSSRLRGEIPDVPLPWDVERMNAGTHAQFKDKPLADVLEEFHHSYRAALALVENLSEEQMKITTTETWPMGPLWIGVAANTNLHYKEHREALEAWLSSKT